MASIISFSRKTALRTSWRTQRWDAFCLVTPNWQCQLPGFPYPGNDPQRIHARAMKSFPISRPTRKKIEAPIREGVAVTCVASDGADGFIVETSEGAHLRRFNRPCGQRLPHAEHSRISEHLPESLVQIHSSAYKNPGQLPEGEVLVVGSGSPVARSPKTFILPGGRFILVSRERAALPARLSRPRRRRLAGRSRSI